jgi:ribosome-binding ATPase YchF (GTP1/OBG family)
MKITIFSLPELTPGKNNIKDARLDRVCDIVKSKKETYVQVDLTGEEVVFESDAILASADAKTDLILKDLEFVETRLSRSEDEKEKGTLNKLKSILEKEEFIFKAPLSAEEKEAISGYSLFTSRPVVLADKADLEDKDKLLAKALKESGYISFFTAGERETRAWPIKNGTTAWEAAGVVHSDIQKGFIRAEIIAFKDFIEAGSENQAKQAGKLRLETKDYIMQDADWVNFRFNK